MSNFVKSGVGFQRLPTESTEVSSRDSSITIGEDLEANPFDGKKTWDEFKKEYYQLEKKIKRGLESLHLTLIEFTKHISLADSRAANMDNTSNLYRDFQSVSSQTKQELSQLSDLFGQLKKNKGDKDELIKQNMFKRFKEIHQEHEREYSRLISSFDLNKKKLELFNETLKLGELKMNKKLDSATVLQIQQNQDLADAVATSTRVLNQADEISKAFGSQQARLNRVGFQVKKLLEEFNGVHDIMRKIKYFKLKRTLVLLVILILLAIYLLYKIIGKFV